MLIIKDYKTPGHVDWAAVDEECDTRLGIKPAPPAWGKMLKTKQPVDPPEPNQRPNVSSRVLDEQEFLQINNMMLSMLNKQARDVATIAYFAHKISSYDTRFPVSPITIDEVILSKFTDSIRRDSPTTMMYVKGFCHVRHHSRLVLTNMKLETEKLLFVDAVNHEIELRGVVVVKPERVLIGVQAALKIIKSYQPDDTICESAFRRMIKRGEVPTVETDGVYLRFDPAVIRDWIEQSRQLKRAS
jgi:hypothetical protein